jgi:hypothetical protein
VAVATTVVEAAAEAVVALTLVVPAADLQEVAVDVLPEVVLLLLVADNFRKHI